MAKLTIDDETTPSAPASGKAIVWDDSVAKVPAFRTSVRPSVIGAVRNQSVAAQAYTTTEIYLTGSSLTVPGYGLQIGTTLRWRIVLTKTAGTAAPVFIIRLGTAGTTSDAARHTFTGFATPSSATDTAWVDIEMIVRTVGAAATSSGSIRMAHQLSATGFANLDHAVERVSSGTFDSTTAGLIAGVTFNHSTAGAGNIEQVTAELVQ